MLDHLAYVVSDRDEFRTRDRDRPLAPLAILPPHSANHHDAGCRGAGVDCRRVKMASGLSDHIWTIKELIEKAAEA